MDKPSMKENISKLPQGFTSSGISAGLKKSGKRDLGLIHSNKPCSYAGVFTKNSIKAHCIIDNLEILNNERFSENIQAIIVNSGNANACTGKEGKEALNHIQKKAAEILGLEDPKQVLTASTGCIGIPLNHNSICNKLSTAKEQLDENYTNFSEAILTTDTKTKFASFKVGKFSIVGIAKGSGMIHPNMATMLAFILTDAPLNSIELKEILHKANQCSFNQISVDGDTSTNDMVLALANGNKQEEVDIEKIQEGFNEICTSLAKQIVADGEGATKSFEVSVKGSYPQEELRKIAKGIAASSLVKSAIFGNDPNWGRVLAAAGQYAEINIETCTLKVEGITVLEMGKPTIFDRQNLVKIMKTAKFLNLTLELNASDKGEEGSAWGCDLTYDYVKINAEYTT
ncbi:MAG TPA: bifunctional glutamate N-acetyltransferase/amino-acid acetyltransferase ArgJ [Vampirovibrionales bacterium]